MSLFAKASRSLQKPASDCDNLFVVGNGTLPAVNLSNGFPAIAMPQQHIMVRIFQ
jgi:hypothetical protein